MNHLRRILSSAPFSTPLRHRAIDAVLDDGFFGKFHHPLFVALPLQMDELRPGLIFMRLGTPHGWASFSQFFRGYWPSISLAARAPES